MIKKTNVTATDQKFKSDPFFIMQAKRINPPEAGVKFDYSSLSYNLELKYIFKSSLSPPNFRKFSILNRCAY